MSDRPERSATTSSASIWKIDKDDIGVAALAARRRDAEHRLRAEDVSSAHGCRARERSARQPLSPSGLEISFRNDPSVLDGRFANNGWLQELPKPITRLTWDNAVLASPATADKLKASQRPRSRAASTDRSSATSSS